MRNNNFENYLRGSFSGASVVVTGHTGFKGSWLSSWLKLLGAKVTGISIDPVSYPSHYDAVGPGGYSQDLRVDIRNQKDITEAIFEAQPDYLFHLAAQALVSDAYVNPVRTWDTNVLGTLNVLEGLRSLSKSCTSVFVTSDKCYENREWLWGYRESDTLGGIDPYSASKAACEILIHSHLRSFFVDSGMQKIATARAGNVIGGGDWSPNRIVPDCIKACLIEKTIEIRNPNSTRPWQHVLEPLGGYLHLAAKLTNDASLHGESFNFGPNPQNNHKVLDLVNAIQSRWGSSLEVRSTQNLNQLIHEAGLLKLNCDKALSLLNWAPVLDFNTSVYLTCDWYKKYYDQPDQVLELTNLQINQYMSAMTGHGLK